MLSNFFFVVLFTDCQRQKAMALDELSFVRNLAANKMTVRVDAGLMSYLITNAGFLQPAG